MSTVAEKLAIWSQRLRYEDLPQPVVHEVKRRVIDSIGCALGAYASEPARIVRELAAEYTSTRAGATVIGSGQRTMPDLATFANGTMVRYLDYNDTYLSKEPAHPSDNIPAALAVAEARQRSGRDLILAIVIGYEIQCRLCDAASLRAHGWDHVNYGNFSVACLAARLLGLSVEQTVHALGIAGVAHNAMRQTRAGTLSEWKACAFANAARNGVFAALLAAKGMSGPAPIFEGVFGFWKLVSGKFALDPFGGETLPPPSPPWQGGEPLPPSPLWEGGASLPPSPLWEGGASHPPSPPWQGGEKEGVQPFKILDTYIKFFPVEYHAQSGVDAALKLREKLGRLDLSGIEDIAEINVQTFDACVDIIAGEPEKWNPTTRETADHSLPYCIAVALRDGEVTLASFDEQRLRDPQLHALMQKIKVHRNAECNAQYPEGIPNDIEIILKSGERLREKVVFPRGHCRNPMSDEEVEAKFRQLATMVLPPAQVEKALRRLWQLEEMDDAGEVLSLVRI
ncbi:MAG: MmgE/PrpD family protein [Abditibacteriales bacterium]|nr:MmgE/PrpD family protein [Abditibacteriales bacterium]MDW8365372.1 MmgE/PrpD family protein [Abditibacteriales bacterium]